MCGKNMSNTEFQWLPDDSWGNLSTNEDAQNADRVGGKHADDGEGEG